MRKLLTFLFLVALFSCTNEDRTRSTLDSAGYTNVVITGWSATGCGDSDGTCTGFEATGPTGKRVSGAVGCGRVAGCSKGCTLRLD